MVWLTGGALVLALLMITCLLGLVFYEGLATFWPQPVLEIRTKEGKVLAGEISRRERFRPEPEQGGAPTTGTLAVTPWQTRRLIRTGNFDITGTHFTWVNTSDIAGETRPRWTMVVERQEWGRFYGTPAAIQEGDAPPRPVAAEEAWRVIRERQPEMRALWSQKHDIEYSEIGRINRQIERARLDQRKAEIEHGAASRDYQLAGEAFERRQRDTEAALTAAQERIAKLLTEMNHWKVVFKTADDQEKTLSLAEIVRAYPPNQMGWSGRAAIYASRWWEFFSDAPREANSEGGVFPAIFGTVMMTLIMALLVVPFGVLAALYLHEYATAGFLVSAVRIAVNNLAGVPSIVFGVFGLGFFCYIIGAGVDSIFFAERLPNPTFGKGGILWAAFTLALLTLPVVIVATEEALAAVPKSMREASYGCGASKWQTIRRIVLPSALPGIMTGMILAMARGAGEVAPLMLVGAVKLAPELPLDGTAPFVHPERSFMHLGFHIYDLGFQSQNSEAAKPMVFTTTLLLIVIVTMLNLMGVWLRSRLRKRLLSSKF